MRMVVAAAAMLVISGCAMPLAMFERVSPDPMAHVRATALSRAQEEALSAAVTTAAAENGPVSIAEFRAGVDASGRILVCGYAELGVHGAAPFMGSFAGEQFQLTTLAKTDTEVAAAQQACGARGLTI